MIVLKGDGSKRFFKHQLKQSCVVTMTDESKQTLCLLIKPEDESAIAKIQSCLVDFVQESKLVTAKVIGSERWLLKLERLIRGMPNIESVEAKPLNDGDWLLVDALEGRVKVKRAITAGAPAASVPKRTVNVMIVDDSATMRKVLHKIFEEDGSLKVGWEAESAEHAIELLKSEKPDVITLDINMPGLDGVEFLKHMQKNNISIPTVVITSLNLNDGDKVFEALQNGAVDYIQKPDSSEMAQARTLVAAKVREAASVNLNVVKSSIRKKPVGVVEFAGCPMDIPVFLGSSTGGTTAIERILMQLAPPIPSIVIVQHIPAVFSRAFAERLDAQFPFKVKEAEDGEAIEKNTVYIAPGGLQMGVTPQKRGQYYLSVRDLPPVNRFKPSVDFLFESVAINYSGPKIGVILTGMGKDGAEGMVSMKNEGSVITIAQDQESSVVFGMPKAAIDLGCVDNVCHIDEIPKKLRESIEKVKSKGRKSA